MPAPTVHAHRSRHALQGRWQVLIGNETRHHQLWTATTAFFVSFVVWFNMAPFAVTIRDQLHLTAAQMGALTLANLALAVPGRLAVGMLLDRFGPRRLYAGLLVFVAVPNTVFAMSHSFTVLLVSRLFVGLIGAGFVVGIRLVAEWYRSEDLGTAEGIYGGWGNFGSAAAALTLPMVATLVASGPGAWRWAVGASGAASAAYGVLFWFIAKDTPDGASYRRPTRSGALAVSTKPQVAGLMLLQTPVAGALALVVSRIEHAGVIGVGGATTAYGGIALLLGAQLLRIVSVNRQVLAGGQPEPDALTTLTPVALLALAYGVTFGTELTMVSLLPTYFATTFGLKIAAAGVAGSAFAFTNLVTRPAGGIVSDVTGRRVRVLVVLLIGAALGFVALAGMSRATPLWLGVLLVLAASCFVQAANGAVFAMVPLVSRSAGGQVAGLAGSYGNVGGIVFSSILFFTATTSARGSTSTGSTTAVFITIAVAATVVAALCSRHLRVATDRAPDHDAPMRAPLPAPVVL